MSIRIAVAVALMTAVWSAGAARAQQHSLVTAPVDDARTVALAGNVRPEVRLATDLGRVPDDQPVGRMLLQLKRAPEAERASDRFVEALHDPSAPEYHRWLTAREYGRRFGASAEDRRAVGAWLARHGFTVETDYGNGLLIAFSGTAGQVRSAFETELHALSVAGHRHIANMTAPRIPAALAPVVEGVLGLHDFRPHAMLKPRPRYTYSCDGSSCNVVTPADLATIYNLNPLFRSGISGKGMTISVIEDSDVYDVSNWSSFRSAFGLSAYSSGSFSQIHPAPVAGGESCPDPSAGFDEGEATLDAEWASAAAPDATIELVSCGYVGQDDALLTAFQNRIAAASLPDVISISYGECEAINGAVSNAAYRQAYKQAAAEGISVFASAGDEDAASCDAGDDSAQYGIGVSALASTKFNVAVGGTDFGDTYAGTNSSYWSAVNTAAGGSALSYIPEIPWNDSCASVLLATYVTGSGRTFGTGFCNTSAGQPYLIVDGGSGGPSGCAVGAPAVYGLVGGSCAGYFKPAWQAGLFGNPSDGVRDLPDVSLFAADGVWGAYYVYCDTDTADYGAPCSGPLQNWAGGGGTSFSSPIMAAIQALVDQKAGGPQGNPNPVYYQIARTEYGSTGSAACNSSNGNAVSASCVFYDVTQGDIDVNCTPPHKCYDPSGANGVLSKVKTSYEPAYVGHPGWDFATGIGTVNAANLVNGWSAGVAALARRNAAARD
jgi:subtilase family serine protease